MKALCLTAAVAALVGAAPAEAQTPVAVGEFDSIELQGGGRVIVRHGPTQSVTLVRGNTDMTGLRVRSDGKLEIDACMRSCRNYDLLVEIVTPELKAVGVSGGGSVRAEGGFPGRDSLALGISGGGQIDMRGLPADIVAAGIDGGGTILTHARERLAAGINGGGDIRYLGSPAVTSGIDGGGTVSRIGARD